MLYTQHHFCLGCCITAQFVRYNTSGQITLSLQQFTKELASCCLVSPCLHQNIKNFPILIDGASQILKSPTNAQIDFIQIPCVTRPPLPGTQSACILTTKLPAPATDRFVADGHSPLSHHLLDVAIADAKPKVQPDTLADDVDGKTVAMIAADSIHAAIASQSKLT